jgi:hypothetical protein
MVSLILLVTLDPSLLPEYSAYITYHNPSLLYDKSKNTIEPSIVFYGFLFGFYCKNAMDSE